MLKQLCNCSGLLNDVYCLKTETLPSNSSLLVQSSAPSCRFDFSQTNSLITPFSSALWAAEMNILKMISSHRQSFVFGHRFVAVSHNSYACIWLCSDWLVWWKPWHNVLCVLYIVFHNLSSCTKKKGIRSLCRPLALTEGNWLTEYYKTFFQSDSFSKGKETGNKMLCSSTWPLLKCSLKLNKHERINCFPTVTVYTSGVKVLLLVLFSDQHSSLLWSGWRNSSKALLCSGFLSKKNKTKKNICKTFLMQWPKKGHIKGKKEKKKTPNKFACKSIPVLVWYKSCQVKIFKAIIKSITRLLSKEI